MTPAIHIDNVVRVPLELLPDPVGLVHALTLESPTGSGSDRFHPLARIDERWGEVIVPRAFNLLPWLKPKKQYVIHDNVAFWPWRRVTLGDRTPELGPNKFIAYDQGPAWEAISRTPHRPYGQILALGCGKGKTVLALSLARKRGVPTLVVCHTINMMNTWAQTAVDLFGVDPSRIGFIGGGKKTWPGKDLVFTTMPGVLSGSLPPQFFSTWGLVIFDEGDLLGAKHLSKILPLFMGERLLVTATVTRSDGMEALYFHHVGKVVYEDTRPDLEPRCYVLDSPVPPFVWVEEGTRKKKRKKQTTERYAWNRFVNRPAPHVPRTVSFLVDHVPERFAWEMEVVGELLGEGRKVLFLGERVEDLKRHHDAAVKLDWESGLALGSSHMTDDEVKAVLRDCRVIWGIQQIAKRGLNQPDIDTIVIQFASFKDENRLQQTVGRALRFTDGGKDPLVVVLNDSNVGCLNNNAVEIVAWLQRQGYAVEWYE